jgi:nitrogen fixation-related uncharacterized protein
MSQQPGGRCYINTLPVPLYIAIPLGLVLIPVVPVTLLWVVGSEKVHDWKDKRKNKRLSYLRTTPNKRYDALYS